MAVINYREVLPRTFSHRFGEAPTAERRFVVTVDEPTAQQLVINAIGIFHGSAHPEYPYLRCLNGSFTETDRHHVEATFSYELPRQENLDPNPLARADVWSFATSGVEVPALFYYDGNAIAPLVNSAGDVFEGATTTESQLRATITGNRPTFDYVTAANITNCLNSGQYLGGQPYTWMCAGISGQAQVEVVNDVEIRYWSFTTELVYNPRTHLLFLPDVGFNYIAQDANSDTATSTGAGADTSDPPLSLTNQNGTAVGQTGVTIKQKKARQAGGVKKRAWVYAPEGGDKHNSPTPAALNNDGSLKSAGSSPDILARRVHPIIDFNQFFGTPPF
jgi:hypothetical protein